MTISNVTTEGRVSNLAPVRCAACFQPTGTYTTVRYEDGLKMRQLRFCGNPGCQDAHRDTFLVLNAAEVNPDLAADLAAVSEGGRPQGWDAEIERGW